MSILDYNLDNVQELATVPEGEYQVRGAGAECKTSAKTGGEYLSIRLECSDEPDAKNITLVMMLPTDSDDEKARNGRLRRLKSFYEAFDIDYTKGVDTDDLVGCSGWAILTEEDDPEYGRQNRVKRFIVGK